MHVWVTNKIPNTWLEVKKITIIKEKRHFNPKNIVMHSNRFVIDKKNKKSTLI